MNSQTIASGVAPDATTNPTVTSTASTTPQIICLNQPGTNEYHTLTSNHHNQHQPQHPHHHHNHNNHQPQQEQEQQQLQQHTQPQLIQQQQELKPELLPEQLQMQQGDRLADSHDQQTEPETGGRQSPATRFKWTKEKTQVAMNLVKYGCKPKLISVAVGCSLRTAQKYAETVTPKMEGESFKTYEIKRRGRKSKDVNQRLNAIREVLSKDSNKTQVEIAADLKVSNTTVCRDLKRIGASWKDKKSIKNLDN